MTGRPAATVTAASLRDWWSAPPSGRVVVLGEPAADLCRGSGQARMTEAATPCPVCAAPMPPGPAVRDHFPGGATSAQLSVWSADR